MVGKMSSEAEITKWLVELIEGEKLLDTIAEQQEIEAAVKSFEERVGIPAFGFDHLSRRANARAALTVLASLSLLEIVAVDKSISLTTGEILRPDILCFNPESRSLVVFEVKRDKLTERQAVTELAGYEQELRNALPFLGDFDVNFVVVSSHWDVLLDHAVANFNTWSGKNCLALKVSAEKQPFTLACHLPDAWQLRGATGIPQEALHSIDVYLYEDGEVENEDDDGAVPAELITAINMIARSGDRYESHGFAMLWRDSARFGRGHWAITLCGVDPIAMFAWCGRHGLAIRPSQLTEYLDKHISDTFPQAPTSLYKIAKESFPVLRGRFDPRFETDCTWEQKIELIRRRSLPVFFEFWGSLGDYARNFVCHSDVRGRYMPFIDRNGFDWTHPDVAFPLIGNISGDIPFPDGIIRCSDAFEAGKTLGLLEFLARISEESEVEAEKLSSLLRWSLLEATRVAIEMAEIYRTVEQVDLPPPPLSTAHGMLAPSVNALCSWVVQHLIGGDHPIHQQCFELGRWGAPYFSGWLEDAERQMYLDAHAEELAKHLRPLLIELIPEFQSFGIEQSTSNPLRQFLLQIGIGSAEVSAAQPSSIGTIAAAELLKSFQDYGVIGLNQVVLPVAHTVGPPPYMSFDWGGIQDGIRQIFASGCKWPAVMLGQNGRFGIGEVEEQFRHFLVPIRDPDLEVYFLDQKATVSIWVKLNWPELQNKLFST